MTNNKPGNEFLLSLSASPLCHFNTAASLVRQFRKIEGLEIVTTEKELSHE
jgi:hypothetical protein